MQAPDRRPSLRPARPRRAGGDASPLARAARAARAGVALALAALFAGHATATTDDAFIRGYASAVLERELDTEAELRVTDGIVRVWGERISSATRERLAAALEDVEGVRGVEIATEAPAPDPAEPTTRVARPGLEVLPEAELFEPLLADPRWPHFSAAAHHYGGDQELGNVAATSFGESIPLVAGDGPAGGRTELGLQAGVFSIFDLDATSFDLVNSDFLVGLAATWRRDDFAAMLRVLHQSSHLGDEYLLRSRVERVNVSFEETHLLLSYDLGEAFRVYAGGGWLLRTDPSDLDRGSLQVGLEYASPRTYWSGFLRPVAGLDLQARQESDWEPDLSVRAGLQLENPALWSQRIQLLLEYYDGRSPNGQFFDRDIRYLGLGTHVHF